MIYEAGYRGRTGDIQLGKHAANAGGPLGTRLSAAFVGVSARDPVPAVPSRETDAGIRPGRAL